MVAVVVGCHVEGLMPSSLLFDDGSQKSLQLVRSRIDRSASSASLHEDRVIVIVGEFSNWVVTAVIKAMEILQDPLSQRDILRNRFLTNVEGVKVGCDESFVAIPRTSPQ